jgi:hypothetical protein
MLILNAAFRASLPTHPPQLVQLNVADSSKFRDFC